MSFLDKIGLKKKKASISDVPPPPPAPKNSASTQPNPKPTPPSEGLPPLPGAQEDEQKQIRDLPTRNQAPLNDTKQSTPQEPPKPKADPAPPPSPTERQAPQAPPSPIRVPQDPPKQQNQQPPLPTPAAPEVPKEQQRPPLPVQPPEAPKQSQPPSRDQMREAFNDVPPVKGSAKQEKKITDDDIQDFEVDKFVLPEEDQAGEQPKTSSTPTEKPPSQPTQPTAPTQQPTPKSQPMQPPIPAQQSTNQDPFSPSTPQPTTATKQDPLFVDIHTYEDIQKRIGDLKKQVTGAGKHIDSILSEREREDQEFAGFIKELEQIQEDLITIDEDLFEEK